MKIKNLEFNNSIFLSPMAGVGDFAFRTLCRKHGADFSFTEMISAPALLHNSKKTLDMLFCLPEENGSGIQLFGDNPSDFAKVVCLPALQHFQLIDLNFGCPAPKIFRNDSGSALLANPKKIGEIVKSCVENTNKPVTAKIRLGIDENSKNASLVAKVCEENGASAIIVHGRTKQQGYSGGVLYDDIAMVKQSVSIPVIGNGDVRDKQTYKKMLETGVDGVSLARASLGKPWIFDYIKGNENIVNEYELVKQHVFYLRQHYTDEYLCKYLRKHFLWYLSSDVPNYLREQITNMQNIDFVLKNMQEFVKKVYE